jgi:hypothetical protein
MSSGASLTRPASTYDPISLFRQFNNILPARSTLPEFAATQRTKTKIGIGCLPCVMVNDIGANLHDDFLLPIASAR